MKTPAGVNQHTQGNVTVAMFGYRSMHSTLVIKALTEAVPEHTEWSDDKLLQGIWNTGLTSIAYLWAIETTGKDELTEDERILLEWWGEAKEKIANGEWREVWESFSRMSYEAIVILADAFDPTRRVSVGLENTAIGGKDSADPLPLEQEPISPSE